MTLPPEAPSFITRDCGFGFYRPLVVFWPITSCARYCGCNGLFAQTVEIVDVSAMSIYERPRLHRPPASPAGLHARKRGHREAEFCETLCLHVQHKFGDQKRHSSGWGVVELPHQVNRCRLFLPCQQYICEGDDARIMSHNCDRKLPKIGCIKPDRAAATTVSLRAIQSRVPANRSAQSARSSSVILRNVMSGT